MTDRNDQQPTPSSAGKQDTSAGSPTGCSAGTSAGSQGEPDWKRKQRLAEIFGDVLPSVTSDERDDPAPRNTESATDRWLKAQVPPHHG